MKTEAALANLTANIQLRLAGAYDRYGADVVQGVVKIGTYEQFCLMIDLSLDEWEGKRYV